MVMDFVVHPNFDDTVLSTKEIEDEDKIVKPVCSNEALVESDRHKGLETMTASFPERFVALGTRL